MEWMHNLYTMNTVRCITRSNKPKHNNAWTSCHPASRSGIRHPASGIRHPAWAQRQNRANESSDIPTVKKRDSMGDGDRKPLRFRLTTYGMGQRYCSEKYPNAWNQVAQP